VAATPVSDAREQIARLKERLAAAQARTGAIEPKRTAAAVRDVVEGLRERLETSARERSELAEALDSARATMARSAVELERERRAREVFEVQAEERRRIADDAVAEAEALAAERDQVLGELAQHRRLEEDQTSLLTQVEAALAERDAERQAAARELAEARDVTNLRAAEIADLEARLRDETAARARAESQCRDLETEIARLTEAREALQSIEAVLVQRRGTPRDDKR
jgi:chromosome segregation ATPase